VKVIRCRDIRRLQTFSSVAEAAGVSRSFADLAYRSLAFARVGTPAKCREFTPPARW
jgi:hypothetical protein